MPTISASFNHNPSVWAEKRAAERESEGGEGSNTMILFVAHSQQLIMRESRGLTRYSTLSSRTILRWQMRQIIVWPHSKSQPRLPPPTPFQFNLPAPHLMCGRSIDLEGSRKYISKMFQNWCAPSATFQRARVTRRHECAAPTAPPATSPCPFSTPLPNESCSFWLGALTFHVMRGRAVRCCTNTAA